MIAQDSFLSRTNAEVWPGPALTAVFLSGPFAALAGNAGSDIWLGVVLILFLSQAAVNRDNQSFRIYWFLLAVVFFAWVLLSASVSNWPYEALGAAAGWIRFPLFTLALCFWLSDDPKLLRNLMFASVTATLILMAVLVTEKIQNPDAIILYGTWKQGTKAGWFLIGMGLPAAMWLFDFFSVKKRSPVWPVLFLIALLFATFLSGQIYVALSMIFAIGMFFAFNRISLKMALAFAICSAIIIAMVLYFDKWLYIRFVELALPRLPWMETSDYYVLWVSGIRVGLTDPLFGVGAGNYPYVCFQIIDVAVDFPLAKFADCSTHPHQLYIQYFSEAGILGLLLFSACAVSLVVKVWRPYSRFGSTVLGAAALSVMIVTFWPISTYSNAFGQHANFFKWYSAGIALAFAAQAYKNARVQRDQAG